MSEPQQSNSSSSDGWLTQLRQSYSQVQLGPGVVGKTSRATLGLLAAWAVVIFRLGTDLMQNCFLFGAGLAATVVYAWWVHRTHVFAEAHPEIALLEGAELIEYQKWEAAANGKSIPLTIPVTDPAKPILIEDKQ